MPANITIDIARRIIQIPIERTSMRAIIPIAAEQSKKMIYLTS